MGSSPTPSTMDNNEIFEWTGYNTGELVAWLQASEAQEWGIRFWLSFLKSGEPRTLYRKGNNILYEEPRND